MAKKPIVQAGWLQTTAVRVTRVHFLYIAIFMLSTIIFDSWNLITHEMVSQLWTVAVYLLVTNTVLWYVSRMKFSDYHIYAGIILLLVAADTIFSSYVVLLQRGLASKAVALFAIPIVTAATLRSRSTLLAATALSAAAYSVISVRYFYQHYGESFKVELYGTVGFYCSIFFVLAWLLLIIIRPTKEKL